MYLYINVFSPICQPAPHLNSTDPQLPPLAHQLHIALPHVIQFRAIAEPLKRGWRRAIGQAVQGQRVIDRDLRAALKAVAVD